jgi:pimeloyl-ACP methyl ester carboxylesterase
VVDGFALDLVLTRAQYSKLLFQDAAQTLVTLQQATRTGATALVARYPDAPSATLYAVTCNDTKFRHNRTTLAREAERLGERYPLNGFYQRLAPCAFWDRPPLELKEPTGKGVPPVLMVQSVRDPATPVEGAQRAHRNFAGSRMLTVTDEGDHGIYAFGNPCVDDIVEAFIVDGELPPRDLTCEGTPLPDPTAPAAASTRPLVGWPL